MSNTDRLCALTCRTCGLVTPETWDKAPEGTARTLDSRKTIRPLDKGAVLFHEGDGVTALFRLLSGVVVLRKGDHDGNSVITRLVTPTATLGFRAFAARSAHSVTALCATDCVVCRIPADAAELAFCGNRSLERAFALHVAHELTYAEDAVLAQMRLSVRDRLILLLAQLAQGFGTMRPDGGLDIALPILRSDIAAMAGIARETFSRVLRGIEADGLLRFEGSTVHVPDAAELVRRAASIRGGS